MAGLTAVGYGSQAGHPAVLFFVAVAIGLTAHATLRSFAFTGWVLACVATALVYPWTVRAWFGYDLTRLIVSLTQIIMFGMLIGSCSGGVASNLMAYLARGNVALSVTMTCISTFLSPLMTPLMMGIFAGEFIAIDVLNSHVAALPPNVFGTWMNISGSMLANWWKRKPVQDSTLPDPELLT